MEKHTAQKVIEHFTNLWVAHDILLMALDELVFTDREILEHLVIKVDFA